MKKQTIREKIAFLEVVEQAIESCKSNQQWVMNWNDEKTEWEAPTKEQNSEQDIIKYQAWETLIAKLEALA